MSGTPLAVRTRPELQALRPGAWMTAAEAALYLGAGSSQTLVEWRRNAVGPDWRREGRYVLYRRADLDLFVARGGVPSPKFPARELDPTPEEIDGRGPILADPGSATCRAGLNARAATRE